MLNFGAELTFVRPGTEKPSYIMQDFGKPAIRKGSFETRFTKIRDARRNAEGFGLDTHGFVLTTQSSRIENYDDDAHVAATYYPEVQDVVRSVTGATQVHVIDHTVRHSQLRPGVRGTASHVHNDYTPQSCEQKLRDHIGDAQAERVLKSRVIQVNAWRPLTEPVRVAPLAVVDGSSVRESDLVACDIVYPDRTGEIYEVSFNDEQQWYYFSEMMRNEMLLIKGYDSIEDGCVRFTPHTAFDHPDTSPNDPERISIEVRTIAIL